MVTFDQLLERVNTDDKTNKAIYVRQTITDLSRVDISVQDIREALERPSSFGYSGGNEDMFHTWSLGPVFRTRDSNIREQSNASALEAALEEAVTLGLFSDEDFEVTGCNHWACGWVDHISFRAIESDEVETQEPTVIFRWLRNWFNALEDYPVADEEDMSMRESEYALEALGDMGFHVHEDAPEDWKERVLSEMDEQPNESYWNESEARRIAHALGFLACSECEGDGWVYDFDVKIPIPVNPDGDFNARRGFKSGEVECVWCDGTGVEPTSYTKETE
jgi:hypothetical protein